MTRLGQFIGLLGKFLKPLATINLPKSPTFLGNFCKDIKIFKFFSEIICGQLLYTFGDFFWSHCPVPTILYPQVQIPTELMHRCSAFSVYIVFNWLAHRKMSFFYLSLSTMQRFIKLETIFVIDFGKYHDQRVLGCIILKIILRLSY